MNRLKEAKKRYKEIIIPEELSVRVQEAINNSEKKNIVVKLQKRRSVMKKSVGTAAAIAVTFTILLNTSTVFAQNVSGMPIIGAVARVLTFRAYEKQEEDLKLSVKIPSVEMISQDTNGLAESINQEIHRLCQQYADEAVQRAEEYKKAFMETGGTEEEWKAHNIEIRVWYEINSQSEHYLSFVIMGTESWNSAGHERKYYNIDLSTQKIVSLKDLLGEDYIEKANESIKNQMKAKSQEMGITFWTPEEGGFTGISDEVSFYINKADNPVIVFEKYEIAPGSAGAVEFVIEKNFANSRTEQKTEGVYEDNFEVKTSAVTAFADKIKEAVAAKDIEALADLTAFPVYVGIAEDGVENREAFIALGAEKVFTPELVESVVDADTSNLSPSMAGFSISKDGKSNIIFGVVEGRLAISGINYE